MTPWMSLPGSRVYVVDAVIGPDAHGVSPTDALGIAGQCVRMVSERPDRLRSVPDSTVPLDGLRSDSPDHSPQTGATTVSLHLRWGDMDLNQHVNNVQFARLFEEARVRTFAAWFEGAAAVLPIVVAQQVIEFRAVLAYPFDPVTVETGVSRIGRSSYTLSCTLTDPTGLLCAVAETTLVAIDPATNSPRAISDDARAVLESHRVDPTPTRRTS